MQQLIEKMSVNPAKILGLKDIGAVKIGQKANLTVVVPDCKYIIDANKMKSKCKISPFEGLEMKGISIATIVDGKLIFNED